MTTEAKANKPAQKSSDRIVKFFREVRAELKKTSWPSRKELISSTGVVIGSVIVVSVFIAGVDLVFAELMSLLVK